MILATGGSPQPLSHFNRNLRWIFSSSLTKGELNTLKRVRSLSSQGDASLVIVCRQERGKGTEVVIWLHQLELTTGWSFTGGWITLECLSFYIKRLCSVFELNPKVSRRLS